MEIKVLCGCGAKFAFEVEPVNGQMPVSIYCPSCSADVTNAANEIIAGKLASTAPTTAAPAPKSRLKVSGGHAPAPTAPTTPSQPAEAPAGGVCNRHSKNPSASNCCVCQKPICLECMSQFGYLCSVGCKYQAEQQGIRVPNYQFQKTAVQNRYWRKVGMISGALALLIGLLIAAAIWYEFSGSHPKPFYSLDFVGDNGPRYAQFLNKDELLLLYSDKLVVHDCKAKKDVWTAAFSEPQNNAADSEDSPFTRFSRWSPKPKLHLTSDAIWVGLPRQVLSFDRQTGARKHSIAISGEMNRMQPHENALFVFSTIGPRKAAATRIDLGTGEFKTQELIPTPVERQFVAEELPSGVPPTAAYLLAAEKISEEQRQKAFKTVYSQFIAAGMNGVEMQVRMVHPNLTWVKAMKDPGPSNLNANTSASSNARAVAEEVFNDIKRSSSPTGGYKSVDESRYRVTLRRFLAESAEPWTGEVTGPPALFPMKTVDVLVAGKMVYVFDKQNKQLFESKLNYTVADPLIGASGASPFLEKDNSLYFFDQGFLTALDLPSGNVRWRVTSVGISKIQADGKGHLYVNSTTASPEDIQYSEQIKMQDNTKVILMKIAEKNGEVLWRSSNLADFRLSEDYVYAMTTRTGGPALAQGLTLALGSSAAISDGWMSGGDKLRVFRINPSNGKRVWEYFADGYPAEVDVASNRIMLRYENKLQLLKYLSF